MKNIFLTSLIAIISLCSWGQDAMFFSMTGLQESAPPICWDIENVYYQVQAINVSSQNEDTRSVRFGDSGNKMYVLGRIGDMVYQYNLTSQYDILSASYSGNSFSVTNQVADPRGLHFSPDGTKMFATCGTLDDVAQYTLSTAWDLSTASYASKSFDFNGQDTGPKEIRFNSTGSKMFVVGTGYDAVYRYSLSPSYDVSTASYDNNSYSVAGYETSPKDAELSPDGTKLYMLGSAQMTIYQFSLSTAWDLSSASYSNKSFDVSSFEPNPTCIEFDPDGESFHVTGYNNSEINRFECNTAWDISTASQIRYSYDVTAWDTNPEALMISESNYYVVGASNDEIFQFSFTDYDPQTSTYIGSASISGQDGGHYGAFIRPNGSNIYTVGTNNDRIYQYTMSTPFAISSLSYSTYFSISSQESSPDAIYMNPKGNDVYILGSSGDEVVQYDLGTPWSISTAVYNSKYFGYSAQSGTASGLHFCNDGTKMFIVEETTDVVYQYNLSTAWEVLSASYSGNSFDITGDNSYCSEMKFANDGDIVYLFALMDAGEVVWRLIVE
jgi:sugar lactone lactonase YvrE